MKKGEKKVIIMGAGGRDFHNFLVYYKNNPTYEVVAFTATQIPGIENRVFPAKIAGKRYPKGIKIYSEEQLSTIIKKFHVDEVTFSYSDVSFKELAEKEKIVTKAGAKFILLSPGKTMIAAKKPVIAVTAVRTGSGKSQTARKISQILKNKGLRVIVIRHPMPYGNLRKQEVERIAAFADLNKYNCTIEEREEYEPHLKMGNIIYAGVDYEKIIRAAENEADIIIWDGGNNDTPFYKPDLWIVVADPHRAGHELTYYPGKINFERANVIVINKVDTAKKADVEIVRKNAKKVNPSATIIEAASPITVDKPELIKGKKVLVIEDGPTTTHGGMKYGAGLIAAKKFGAKIVDPKQSAVGSIKEIFKKYPYLKILPAMGYGAKQIAELQATINKTKVDAVVDGTPINLGRLIKVNKPVAYVTYELKEVKGNLDELLRRFIRK